MKKTWINEKIIYMSLCRIAAFVVTVNVLCAKKTVELASAHTGGTFAEDMLKSRAGIAAVIILFILFEAVAASGEYFKAKRLFEGALVFMCAVFFVLLIKSSLKWYIPAVLLPWILIRLIYRRKISRLVFTALLLFSALFFAGAAGIWRLGTVFLIFLVIVGLADLMYMDHFIWIPYYLFLAVLLIFMPAGKKPVDWNVVVKTALKAERLVDDAMTDLSYHFGALVPSEGNASGYNGLGRMGSGINEGTKQELKLYGNFKGTAYLSGASYKKLQNNGWSKRWSTGPVYNGWFISYLDMLYKNGVTKDEASRFSETEKMGIEYWYIRTADLIHPVTTLFMDKDTKAQMTGDPGDYRFSAKKGKGSFYDLTWLAIDYGAPELAEMLCKHTDTVPASYEELEKYCSQIYPFELSSFITKDDYVNYINGLNKDAKDPLLLDTGMSTNRMKELAASITEGLESDYEKAAAIEAYLRQYEYDRTADHSDSKNFTDSFLFDVKKGYCVHYASAMVELLRLSGIRARYCEGYAVSCKKGDRETDVKSGSAHAWPEAYINGIGWIPFEPTASRPSPRENGWERRPDAGNAYIPKPQKLPESPEVQEETEEEKGGFSERYGSALKILLYALILLIVYLMLYLFIRIIIRRVSYSRKDDEEKLIENVLELKEIIKGTYSKDLENAPLRDYKTVLKDEDKRLADEVFEEYNRIRFSGLGKKSGQEKLRIYSEQLKRSAAEEYIKNGSGRFRRLKMAVRTGIR